MIKFNKAFETAKRSLNEKQLEAVETIEGPVLVVAGPETGKTQILAARIGNILMNTDAGPENILALTYTDAGAMAMRKRLIQFIGAEAYKININTFHGFANGIIQEHPYIFAKGALNKISDLEEMQYLDQIIDDFPSGHPMKKWKQDNSWDRKKLKNLFDIIKKENWSIDFLINAIDDWVSEMESDPTYIYQKKYKDFVKGDLKKVKFEKEVLKPMNLLRSAALEYEKFQQLMIDNAKYDYNDMILWVLQKFNDPEYEDLLRDYQEQFQYVLVDEYQDTNGSQNALLFKLVAFWEEPNIFVVGDDDQSIYRFQGANIDNITDYAEKYKNSIKIIELVNNYRSTQSILDVSRSLIEKNKDRLVDNIDFINKDLKASNTEIIKHKADPELLCFQNEIHQAVHIGDYIEELKSRDAILKETAIIYRKHKQSEHLMKYFDAKNIPYQVKIRKDILESVFIRNLINILNYVAIESGKAHSKDDLLFEIMHYSWFEIPSLSIARLANNVRNKKFKKWRELIADVRSNDLPDLFDQGKTIATRKISEFSKFIEWAVKETKNVTLQLFIERVIAKSGLLKYIINSPNKIELMQELQTFYAFVKEEIARTPDLDIAGLVSNIELYKSSGLAIPIYKIIGDTDGVLFTTAHGSKGLEFENVFIINCSLKSWEKSGQAMFRFKLPGNLSQGDDGSDIQESRRLFYVALTRAKKNLFLCAPKFDFNDKELSVSRFVTEVVESGVVTNGIEENVTEISAEKVFEFEIAVFEEPPTPQVEKIEAALIEKTLQKYQLSVTHLSAYLKCPRNFYFNNILRAPAAANHNMAFGTAMHSVLQDFFEMMRKNNEHFPEIEVMIQLFDKHIKSQSSKLTKAQSDKFIAYSRELLPKYYEHYINKWHKIVRLEYNASNVVIDEVPLKGMLDKLEFNGDEVNVVDYKTGKLKKERFYRPKPKGTWKDADKPTFEEEYGGDYWRQAVFYKLLVDKDSKNKWKVVSSEFDFLELQDDVFKKQKIDITEEDLMMLRKQIKFAWENIHKQNFDGECKDPYCRWCSFIKDNFEILPEQEQENEAETDLIIPENYR